MARALILIIDPSPETRAMYADCFRHHDFDVAEAADGAEGVRLLPVVEPDLVVTELSTGPDGAQALSEMRRPVPDRETPMILCSVRIDPEWPCAPSGIDVDVVLPKPLSPRTLLLEAEHLLIRRAGGRVDVAI
jgi:DNA-binding response OmpR family regulator